MLVSPSAALLSLSICPPHKVKVTKKLSLLRPSLWPPETTQIKFHSSGFLFKLEGGARMQARGGDVKNILRELIVRYTGR